VSNPCDPVPNLVLAGRRFHGNRVLEKFLEYPQRTPGHYDLPPSASPRTLTRAKVVRTRAISSRTSNSQADWFVARAAEAGTPWPDDDADLRDGCASEGSAHGDLTGALEAGLTALHRGHVSQGMSALRLYAIGLIPGTSFTRARAYARGQWPGWRPSCRAINPTSETSLVLRHLRGTNVPPPD
jgi:hypothetical protein